MHVWELSQQEGFLADDWCSCDVEGSYYGADTTTTALEVCTLRGTLPAEC